MFSLVVCEKNEFFCRYQLWVEIIRDENLPFETRRDDENASRRDETENLVSNSTFAQP